jgi:hypothetical protein
MDPATARYATIPSGFYRYVDFVQASGRGLTTEIHRRRPRVCVLPKPSDDWYLAPGRHEMFVAVTAANAGARVWKVTLEWDGGWDDDPTAWWGDHLRVERVRKVRFSSWRKGA